MSLLSFQKPDKVVMHRASDFEGSFEFGPLEKGYGVTIGNSLRRSLLTSLEGYSIVKIKIPGVDHEFSAMEGVLEDMVEVVLNLKEVRLKPLSEEDTTEKIFVSLTGESTFTGAHISDASSNFEVLNHDLVICNMEPDVNFEIELEVNKGRGYVPAEFHKDEKDPIGTIAIDAIYSPIKKVSYKVENTRVGQATDYEKLLIDLVTDGSIHPETALKDAAKILIHHFMLFSDETMTLEADVVDEDAHVDEKFLQIRKLLKTNLTDLDLSVRAYNCLRAANITTLGELVSYDIADLLKFRNFGKKSLSELEDLVRDKNLNFGMDVSRYNLDED